MMILSTVLITLALIFYSTGIWAERIARLLKPWHMYTFWTGLVLDVSGTLVTGIKVSVINCHEALCKRGCPFRDCPIF